MNSIKNSALSQPDNDAESAQSLLVLVQHLTISISMSKEAADADQTKTLVSDIGESLSQAALAWAQLTDALVESRQVHQAVVDAHENARARSHMSDLSAVVSMDVDLSKLSKIRDLTAQFSRDVYDVWNSGPTSRGNNR
ncbi:hypothetical protein AK830_g2120 [Neonectria ditissima]|uniref:Uncharacterized protein n=1 Tax=Neonectria ditissima TaxID=78410 RepID=A0A0N8H8F5_9HYPO|nr:hypothetical protein AK830_g2120 [Neonectria ditissima]